ncbi:MAG: hypothetical protein LBP26_07775 [Clostridiales bacterium]|jgi:putative heme utilization carrier protein HutX|nr:hypothetical protein [Clostridiales bacterium]
MENSELKQKIADYLAENPNEHLRTLAEVFAVPEREIAAAYALSVKVPVGDFAEVWNAAAAWEGAMFYVDHGDVIVEYSGKLPKGEIMFDGTMLNLEPGPFGGHVYLENLDAVYLIKKTLYGTESLSVMFYNTAGASMFGLFAGRDGRRKIIPSVRDSFEELWQKYSVRGKLR